MNYADRIMTQAQVEMRRFIRRRGRVLMRRGWSSPRAPLGPFRTLDTAYWEEVAGVRHWTSFKLRPRVAPAHGKPEGT